MIHIYLNDKYDVFKILYIQNVYDIIYRFHADI